MSMSEQQAPATCPVCEAAVRDTTDRGARYTCKCAILVGVVLVPCGNAHKIALQLRAENANWRRHCAELEKLLVSDESRCAFPGCPVSGAGALFWWPGPPAGRHRPGGAGRHAVFARGG
jgi:hypothetical protein